MNSRMWEVTANNIAFAAIERRDFAMVYDDKGASHFGATFEHIVDFRISADI